MGGGHQTREREEFEPDPAFLQQYQSSRYNEFMIPKLESIERGQKFLSTFMVGVLDDPVFTVARRIIGREFNNTGVRIFSV